VFGKERELPGKTSSSSPDEFFTASEAPKIITVSGANKDIGKSSLAAYMANHCFCCAGVKVSVHDVQPEGDVVVEEPQPPPDLKTDTARLVQAGASPVFWVRTTGANLVEDVKKVLSRIETPVVIFEGNSILKYLQPDYAVFIMGPTFDNFKPSAFDAIKKAHTVVINGRESLSGEQVLELERKIKDVNPKAKVVVVSEIGEEKAREIILSRAAGRLGGECMMAEASEKVREAVKAKSEEGRIACAVALKLAKDLEVPPMEVGKAANEMDIKITKCSLGCF
jgi:LAO/AO transport system kinase